MPPALFFTPQMMGRTPVRWGWRPPWPAPPWAVGCGELAVTRGVLQVGGWRCGGACAGRPAGPGFLSPSRPPMGGGRGRGRKGALRYAGLGWDYGEGCIWGQGCKNQVLLAGCHAHLAPTAAHPCQAAVEGRGPCVMGLGAAWGCRRVQVGISWSRMLLPRVSGQEGGAGSQP